MKRLIRVVATFILLLATLGVFVSAASTRAVGSVTRVSSAAITLRDEQPPVSGVDDSATASPSDTDTPTLTATATDTPTDTPTDAPTDMATVIPTDTPTATATDDVTEASPSPASDTPMATATPTTTPATPGSTKTPTTPLAKPAVVVAAATVVPPAQLTLSTSAGIAGSMVTVTLANFPRGRSATVIIGGVTVGSIYVGSNRSGSKSFIVPLITHGGHTIRAISNTTSASHSFYIYAHEAVSATTVTRGHAFTVYVDGFGANQTLSLRLYLPNGSSNYSTLLHFSVNANGYGAVFLIMPAGATTGYRKLSSYSASTHAGVYITVTVGSPTTLFVNKTNAQGTPLAPSCFSVYVDAGGGALGAYVTGACDSQDGSNDGVVTFVGLDGGDYVLKEFHAPNGYLNGALKRIHVASSGTTSVTVVDQPGGATLTVHKVDANTSAVLTGACWTVFRDDGSHQLYANSIVESRCDASDGSENGITPFTGLAAGNYILYERTAPNGYAQAPNVLFTVDGNEDPVSKTVQDQPSS